MNAYISKPFSLAEIDEVIKKFVSVNDSNKLPPQVSNIQPKQIEFFSNEIESIDIINARSVSNILEVEKQTGKKMLPILLDGYIQQMEAKLFEIRSDAVLTDLRKLGATAHSIKSMSANLGAERVRYICAKLESDSKDGKAICYEQALLALDRAYSEFVKEFSIQYIA